jgi:hypothetical protein
MGLLGIRLIDHLTTWEQEVVKPYVDATSPDLGNLLTRFFLVDLAKYHYRSTVTVRQSGTSEKLDRRYQCRMVRYGCAEERAVFHGQTRMSKFFTIMPPLRKPYNTRE